MPTVEYNTCDAVARLIDNSIYESSTEVVCVRSLLMIW